MGLLIVLFAYSLLVTPLSASIFDDKTTTLDVNLSDTNPHTSPRTQLLALNPFYQCKLYPKVCRSRGSVNPDCCNNKCVNVDTDCLNCGFCGKKCASNEICCKGKCVNVLTSRNNCGYCGMKCKYNETCCKGKCKNIYYDKRNCGACHNKCKYGEFCAYGMCNYA